MDLLKKQKQNIINVIVTKTKFRVSKTIRINYQKDNTNQNQLLIRINYQKQFALSNKLVGYIFVYWIFYQTTETVIIDYLGRKLYYKLFFSKKATVHIT